jgi:vacuolar protein sorting-associated protein 54
MKIAASLSSELVSVLRSDLELRINKDGKADAEADQGLKDRLKPLLLNLVRTKGLKEGILSWREVVLIEVKGVVKKVGFYIFFKRRLMMLWGSLGIA